MSAKRIRLITYSISGYKVTQTGIWLFPSGYVTCSPDGLIYTRNKRQAEGMIEVKCPAKLQYATRVRANTWYRRLDYLLQGNQINHRHRIISSSANWDVRHWNEVVRARCVESTWHTYQANSTQRNLDPGKNSINWYILPALLSWYNPSLSWDTRVRREEERRW